MQMQTCRMEIADVEARFRAAMDAVIARGGSIARETFGVSVSTQHDGSGVFVPNDGPCCALGALALVEQPSPGWREGERIEWDDYYGEDEFEADSAETEEEAATNNVVRLMFGWTDDEHGAFMMAFDNYASDDQRRRWPEVVALAERLSRDYTWRQPQRNATGWDNPKAE